MLIISLTGIQVLLNIDKPHEALRNIPLLLGNTYGFFYLSYPCQRLMDESYLVFEHAYSSKWYEMPLECRKLLLMIMMRSMEACKMTAGKIFVMNLESFSVVVRTSLSYFTMLSSIR